MPRRESRLLLTASAIAAVTACSQAEPRADTEGQVATIADESSAAEERGLTEVAAPDETDSLRMLAAEEVTAAISEVALRILHEHRGRPLGYEVPFELEGRRYVGRLERHYHPPDSGYRPVGDHVGVTVYLVE